MNIRSLIPCAILCLGTATVLAMSSREPGAEVPQPPPSSETPEMTFHWEDDVAVYQAGEWDLRIAYLQKGTRSEGQQGTLLRGGQPVPAPDSGDLSTPLGELKHYGDDRPTLWSVSGWNFADRKQIRRSEELLAAASAEIPRIKPEDGETTLTVTRGGTFEVELAEQAGTAYHWELNEAAKSAALVMTGKTRMDAAGDGRLGGPVTVVFAFTAREPGEHELHFLYRRPFEKDKPPEKEQRMTVVVE